MKWICYFLFFYLFIILCGCRQKNSVPSTELISAIQLKRGKVISCGAIDKHFGKVNFNMTCVKDIIDDFNLAVALLHSFEYEESEKVFALVIDKKPDCAMAYWGVAMSNFHPLWTPPAEDELKKGGKAIEVARSLKTSKR